MYQVCSYTQAYVAFEKRDENNGDHVRIYIRTPR